MRIPIVYMFWPGGTTGVPEAQYRRTQPSRRGLGPSGTEEGRRAQRSAGAHGRPQLFSFIKDVLQMIAGEFLNAL